jgi:hypothetical protein
MGYGGMVVEQAEARRLRALGWTVPEIAASLGVARSSVSTWVRDVPWTPRRGRPPPRAPNRLARARADDIAALRAAGRAVVGELSERDLLVAGAALYAGEGAKGDGQVKFANTDPRMIAFFCAWLRRFFEVDERRLRVQLYLHEGLDLDAAVEHWVRVTGIPPAQFLKPYRAVADPSRRRAKHEFGCPAVRYACSRTHRAVMGLVDALLASNGSIPG